ncbi:hypothetical protein [Lapidilactobacillus wuchangensis]|uniref:hypothetical protein n=1 Tax=Lapidilactobacillus wuchangensis TaxID=2486001 RepID=UPI000F796E70|nr:hypothetical protein [Lapidilactobacillus wuchangensis]
MDQEDFAKIALAVRNLPTVRQPFPENIDQVGLQRDMNQISRLLNRDLDDAEVAMSYLGEVILFERLFFNRSLQQITVASLADLVLVALPAIGTTTEELTDFVGAIFYFCQLIAANELIANSSLMGANFIDAVRQRRPELTDDIAAADEDSDSRLAMGLSNHFFTEQLVLLPAGLTSFYSQDAQGTVDFAEFIEQTEQQQDPALLAATLLLFIGDEPGYLKILAWAPTSDRAMTAVSTFVSFWRLPAQLTAAGLLTVMQSYQNYLDFCVAKQLLSRATAEQIRLLGNHYLLEEVYHDPAQSQAMAAKIFSGVGQRLNIAAGRQALLQNPYPIKKSTATIDGIFRVQLKLSTKLDQHQLDLELNRARKFLAIFTGDVTGDELPELNLFMSFVLKIHQTMVKQYNRRLSQWTYQSLLDCLETLFEADTQLAAKPTILRFLQLYLFTLDDEGAVKNADMLFTAIEDAADTYLCHSASLLAK